MSLIAFNHSRIVGISACVPKRKVHFSEYIGLYSEKELKKKVKVTGIEYRRFANDGQCASDFAEAAGNRLLDDLHIPRESIDILIFLTQTPDYLGIPPTSCILQHKLHLPKTTGAFDINMNCSGFVFALSTAFAYSSATKARVLLLVGETLSKVNSPTDKTVALLFGDGGAAVLIDYDENDNQSYFSLNTDGENFSAIMIPDGGYRNPITKESLELREYLDGSIRRMNQAVMDGMKVFDFTQEVVVPDVRKVLGESGRTKDDIAYYFFHQANKFMIDLFAMELDVGKEKCPISIDRFGNTSTVSIPLGIVADFGENKTKDFGTVIFSGYGGGLSWGTTCLTLNNCYVSELQELE